jgi:hypothetical protein
MEKWREDLKIETLELAKKLNKLGDFMKTKEFPSIQRFEKDLYYEQYHAMLTYLHVLGKICELHKIALNDTYEYKE